jgi:hypothetical protein
MELDMSNSFAVATASSGGIWKENFILVLLKTVLLIYPRMEKVSCTAFFKAKL